MLLQMPWSTCSTNSCAPKMTSKMYTDVVCSHTLADALNYFVCLTFYHFCNTMCGLKLYSKQSYEFCHAIATIPHSRRIDHLSIIKLSEDFRIFLPQKFLDFLIKYKTFLKSDFKHKISYMFYSFFMSCKAVISSAVTHSLLQC